MGFLKKITRPISKVLDKVIPNEIKPALPFLSAAAPFLLPAGIAGGSGISALLRRGALTGGINIASQLAQEGSEGDFSGLSALLAAGTGALTAPGASSTLEQFRSPVGEFDPARTFLQKGKDMGITGLQKASEFLTTSGETLRSPGFNKPTAEAALLPVTQGTMDLGIAEARRAAKDFADEALASLPEGASDADRALAIRQFMEAAGYFSEDEIVDTITAAGYADGGRVGLEFGGIPAAVEAVEEKPKEFLVDKLKVTIMPGQSEEMGILNAMFNDVEGVMPDDRKMEFYKLYIPQLYERGKISKAQFEGMKEDILGEGKKDGGRINFDEGGISLDEQQMEIIKGGGPKIVGLLADADKMMGTEGDRLDMALKMLLRDNEDNELLKYMLDTAEERGTTKLNVLMDLIRSQRISDISAFDRGKKSLKDDISVKDLARKEGSMKDGGLIDLGGKEMDLRGGGFVPIGKKERADDVPARLSKNEFVMTADAVRGAGGGDINKGAKRMYETMNRLEARA